MAKSEYIFDIDSELATIACEKYTDQHGRYPQLIVANGNVEIYGGNANERAKCRQFIEGLIYSPVASEKASEKAETPATGAQMRYLDALVHADPAAGLSFNLTAGQLPTMSKSEASSLISMIKNY